MNSRSILIVGKGRPLLQGYIPQLRRVGNIELERSAAFMLGRMLERAEQNGTSITLLSGYRTAKQQAELFDKEVKNRLASTGSYEKALREAVKRISLPGESEHNAGLAVDIEASDCFGWLLKNCTDFGFILRYPKGKAHITGFEYKPWHFRYVTPFDAKRIEALGVTLEEYVQLR